MKFTFNDDDNSFTVIEAATENPFMKSFLNNMILRKSCYACPVKGLSSGSDITLGDFWGIERVMPEIDDDKGVSLVLCNTPKGKKIFEKTLCEKYEVSYNDVVKLNENIENSSTINKRRAKFFKHWNTENVTALMNRLSKPDIAAPKEWIWRIIASALRTVGLYESLKRFYRQTLKREKKGGLQ
jgi:hypothetical protein